MYYFFIICKYKKALFDGKQDINMLCYYILQKICNSPKFVFINLHEEIQMVRIWQAKCSSLLLCVFIVVVACMRSSAAATLKLGCFLYICLPKAVIHMKQAIETEWLK